MSRTVDKVLTYVPETIESYVESKDSGILLNYYDSSVVDGYVSIALTVKDMQKVVFNSAANAALYPNATAHPTAANFYWRVCSPYSFLSHRVYGYAYVDNSEVASYNMSGSFSEQIADRSYYSTVAALLSSTRNSNISFGFTQQNTTPYSSVIRGNIVLYFTCYKATANADSGFSGATAVNITRDSDAYNTDEGFYGDTVVFACTAKKGYKFKRWKDANGNTVSTSQVYKATIGNADLTLTAESEARTMIAKTQSSIIYNGATHSQAETTVPYSISYNSAIIANTSARSINTLTCANKLFKTDIYVDAKRLTCRMKRSANSNIIVENTMLDPSGYTPIDSIAASGTQYIPCNWTFDRTKVYRFVYDIQYNNIGRRCLQAFSGNCPDYWGVTAAGQYELSNVTLSKTVGQRDEVVWEYDVGHNIQKLYINGALEGEMVTTDGTYIPDGDEYYLFGLSAYRNYEISGKLFAHQIYENGVLTHEYHPYRRNSDGVCGLMDFVESEFLIPTGAMSPGGTNMLLDAAWSLSGVSIDDAGKFTFNAGGLSMATTALPTPVANHIYYGRVFELRPANCVTIADGRFEYFIGDGANMHMVFSQFAETPMDGLWHKKSARLSLNAPVSGQWSMRNFTASATVACYRRDPLLVDLTAMFGAGREPSKDWCDSHM